MKRLATLLFFALALCVSAPPTRAQGADDYYKRATARFKQGDADGALADFAKAVEVDPQYTEAYASRGLILLARHQDADAQKDFDKYLQLNPAAKDNLAQRIKYAKYQRTKKPKT